MKKNNSKSSVNITKRKVGRPSKVAQGEVKDLILKAYFEICHEEGIRAGTLQKVAERSGVAFATVRYHFNIQGQHLSEVALKYLLEHAFQWIDRGINERRKDPLFDPVQSYIEVMFQWIEAQPVFSSYLAYFYYLCTTRIELPFSNKELIENAQRRVQTLLHEGLGMKRYRYEGDTLEVSQQIHAIVMGGFIIGSTIRNLEVLLQQKNLCKKLAAQLLSDPFHSGII